VEILDATAGLDEGSIQKRLRPLMAWKLGRKLNKKAGPKDLIVCNGYFSWNARAGRRLVIFHGTELGRAKATADVTSKPRNLVVRTLNARLDARSGRGSTVVAVSESTKRELEGLYRLKVDRVIPNGLDLDFFRPPQDKAKVRSALGLPADRFLVLYAGPPDKRKGFDFLINEVRARLGPGQSLVLTADLKNQPSNLIALGRIDFKEMVKYYQACDALIMPSYYEGCSYALAEALACGLPSIVSSVGSAMDMLEDNTLGKFVVEDMNPDGYVSRIAELQNSAEERRAASEASRRFEERHYDIKDFNKEYAELVASLTAGDR